MKTKRCAEIEAEQERETEGHPLMEVDAEIEKGRVTETHREASVLASAESKRVRVREGDKAGGWKDEEEREEMAWVDQAATKECVNEKEGGIQCVASEITRSDRSKGMRGNVAANMVGSQVHRTLGQVHRTQYREPPPQQPLQQQQERHHLLSLTQPLVSRAHPLSSLGYTHTQTMFHCRQEAHALNYTHALRLSLSSHQHAHALTQSRSPRNTLHPPHPLSHTQMCNPHNITQDMGHSREEKKCVNARAATVSPTHLSRDKEESRDDEEELSSEISSEESSLFSEDDDDEEEDEEKEKEEKQEKEKEEDDKGEEVEEEQSLGCHSHTKGLINKQRERAKEDHGSHNNKNGKEELQQRMNGKAKTAPLPVNVIQCVTPQGITCCVATVTMPRDCSERMHYHRQTEESCYVLSGRALFSVVGQEDRVACAGECAVMWPGEVHRIANAGREDLVLLCVCMPAGAAEATYFVE